MALQFNTKLPLPPNFITPSVFIPINDLNNSNYGTIIHVEATGLIEITISLRDDLPLEYHQDYIYHHNGNINIETVERWKLTPSQQFNQLRKNGKLPQNQTVNDMVNIFETYTTGQSFDILLWYRDGVFDRSRHQTMQLSIKTHGSPCIIQVSPPESITSDVLAPQYQSQYMSLAPNVLVDENDDDHIDGKKVNFAIEFATNDSDCEDDDNGHYAKDSTHNISSPGTPCNDVDDDPFDVDDDPFAEDDNDTTSNAVSQANSYQSSQTSKTLDDNPNTQQCPTCRESISKHLFVQHSLHCSQRYVYCELCQRKLLKVLHHTHCDHCNIGTTVSQLPTHIALFHEKITCVCNDHEFEEYKQHYEFDLLDENNDDSIDDDDVKEAMMLSSYTPVKFYHNQLQFHYHSCPLRDVRCKYCRNWFQLKQLDAHEAKCKQTEFRCEYCDLTTTVGERNNHYSLAHHFHPFLPRPDPKEWREENLYKDQSAEITPNYAKFISGSSSPSGANSLDARIAAMLEETGRGAPKNDDDKANDNVPLEYVIGDLDELQTRIDRHLEQLGLTRESAPEDVLKDIIAMMF